MTVVRSIEGDTVDLVCWRELGRTAEVVEETLERNPGLAELGPILPTGTPINLPEATAAPEANTRDIVQLWS
ncbi:MAG: phage tail protein [Citromicrobium sp.]|nr:phage tail protein [Citromicrobium sp.]